MELAPATAAVAYRLRIRNPAYIKMYHSHASGLIVQEIGGLERASRLAY